MVSRASYCSNYYCPGERKYFLVIQGCWRNPQIQDNRGTRIIHNDGRGTPFWGFAVQNTLENAKRSFAKIERNRPWYDYARDKLS